MKVKYSVIVPVYNSERYLEQCMNSLMAQTYRDFEIIVINDGSNDLSEQILAKYKNEENIKVFYQANSGSSIARFNGIEKSSGKYIIFVDSDDYVEKNFIEQIDQYIDKDTDLLQFGSDVFYKNNDSNLKPNVPINITALSRKQFIDEIVKGTIVNGTNAVVLWDKVYRRELIVKYVKEYKHSVLEDYVFNMQYYVGVNKYIKISNVLYHYRYHENSLSRRVNINTYNILCEVEKIKTYCMKMMNIYTDKNYKDNAAAWFVRYVRNHLIQAKAHRNNKIEINEYINKVISDAELKNKCQALKNSGFDDLFSKSIRKNNKSVSKMIIETGACKFRLKNMVKKAIGRK